MKLIGPIKLTGPVVDGEVRVPLATLERPLWPSTNRGAKVSRACGGIRVTILDERMARSLLFEAADAGEALRVRESLDRRRDEVTAVVQASTRFGKFRDMHYQILGRMLFIRLEMQTGDAAGHNMVTLAADRLATWLSREYPALAYVSISGNYCTDKKVSAVNGILGRGRSAVAELTIPADGCAALLKTTPARVVDLNIKKNLIGTMLAGGVRTANAHYANILLGFYLATGQDAANIVEGSQGITFAEVRDGGALGFSVTLPSIIVGTVGSGKGLPYVRENLELLGCSAERPAGENARRLAAICAATVLCGELSLLAAQTNPGELMRAHETLERRGND
ncbi:MAG: hydroxymethylglutaryl-CoA reductase [Lentisphaerae bacterium]|nr:hydroxymethylglutaryl-CoA reductase [Lentisphaerota bacterium]